MQVLATKLYKIKNKLLPEIFAKVFALETESYYNLKWCNDFRIPSVRAVCDGSGSTSFLGPKI